MLYGNPISKMKRIFLKRYSLIVFFTVSLVYLGGCSKKSNSLKITDFSKPIRDTLFPNTNRNIPLHASYTTKLFEIKGTSNDTILIKFGWAERKYIGEFSDGWGSDYYGESTVIFEFDTYLADKGEILVNYSIE